MDDSCIFCKIVREEIPAYLIYSDDRVIVFDDIHPKAPIHKLIVPRIHIPTVNDLELSHNDLIGHMVQVARQMAEELAIDKTGYRVVMNCNPDAGQVIFHLHMHLLGGRRLGSES
jgi:histidine triad (HIT) family protein